MKEISIQVLIAFSGTLWGGFVANAIWLRFFRKHTKLNNVIRASMHTDLRDEVARQKVTIAELTEEVKTWRKHAAVALRLATNSGE